MSMCSWLFEECHGNSLREGAGGITRNWDPVVQWHALPIWIHLVLLENDHPKGPNGLSVLARATLAFEHSDPRPTGHAAGRAARPSAQLDGARNRRGRWSLVLALAAPQGMRERRAALESFDERLVINPQHVMCSCQR